MTKKTSDDIEVINRTDLFDFPLSPFDAVDAVDKTIEGANGGANGDDTKVTDNDGVLITQPKLYFPPMTPLSEPVLPNGINYNHIAVDEPKKRKDNAPKTRPAFVMKIWSMVNDISNDKFIKWDDTGETFQVFQREEFMKNILPKYFKHNNFASFVRQLNMYGWHKVQDITTGLFKDDKSGDENWKFENPNFKRGREDLLDNIVRNKSVGSEETVDRNQNWKVIFQELESVKLNQLAILEELRRIRKDNKTLWHENYLTRERHSKQSATIEQILKFLASIYGQQKVLPDFDGNAKFNETIPETNDLFEELGVASPKPRPRLMLMDQAFKSPNYTPNYGNSPNLSNSINANNSPNLESTSDLHGLEQNIYKQGQSIQQVQDWIQKLSSQQQQLQQQQQQLQQSSGVFTPKFDLDFDVNDFIEDVEEPKRKRFKGENIDELDDSGQIKELN